MEMATRAAIWVRVSTGSQEAANQVPEIERFAAHHGYEIVERYEVSDSAWNGGKDGGEYQRTLKRAQDDAWAGKFSTLVVWSLDRISRGGAEDAQVELDLVLDAGPADLDDHVAPVLQQRTVDLRDRGGGEGLGVDPREDVRP